MAWALNIKILFYKKFQKFRSEVHKLLIIRQCSFKRKNSKNTGFDATALSGFGVSPVSIRGAQDVYACP